VSEKWLEWGRRLQALAQNGLAYAENPFDVERYTQLRELAAEIIAAHSGLTVERAAELFAEETSYATPKVDVRGVVFKDDGILLVREMADRGRWTLPGGWADVGESPREAVVREVHEESGFETRPVKLLAVYDKAKHGHPPDLLYIYKLFILCELIGGEAAHSIETQGAAFFREDDIPELSIGRTTKEQLARMFEHYRNPDLPTEFD